MSEEVKVNEENQFTFENPEYRKTYWHTCSHVLAQAVKRLWPEVKLAIGPSIDNGFYYDLLAPFSFTPENLAEIEAEMRKICKEKLKLERFELPRAEAIKFMEEKDEPFKVELINDLPEDAVISFYKQGEFTDLCAGPHLDSTGRIKGNGIKLTACNAAYWRGDSQPRDAPAHLRRRLPEEGRAGRLPRRRSKRPRSATTTSSAASSNISPPSTASVRAFRCCCPRARASCRCSSAGSRMWSRSAAIFSPRPR